MRTSWLIGTLAILLPTAVSSIETEPFSPPEQGKSSKRALDVLRILRRDDDNCPSGYNPCSDLGNSDACCKSGSRCTTDAADNIACCRTGASCTGSLTGTSTGTTTQTGNSFMFPHGTSATTTGTGTVASITGSTINGAYPFVYVPTTFENTASCSSYYSLCQSEYTQCTGDLMGRYGVTIGGGGGGVTVEAITGSAQATSICSSLSAKACHGLRLNDCATAATGTGNDASDNAAIPGRTSNLHDLSLAFVVGIAGMFV